MSVDLQNVFNFRNYPRSVLNFCIILIFKDVLKCISSKRHRVFLYDIQTQKVDQILQDEMDVIFVTVAECIRDFYVDAYV